MELYGYENVYHVTNYDHPFDDYRGQNVILFDEFRSSLPVADMLKYLDGYPLMLPCRYSNKVACYTKSAIFLCRPSIPMYSCRSRKHTVLSAAALIKVSWKCRRIPAKSRFKGACMCSENTPM